MEDLLKEAMELIAIMTDEQIREVLERLESQSKEAE